MRTSENLIKSEGRLSYISYNSHYLLVPPLLEGRGYKASKQDIFNYLMDHIYRKRTVQCNAV